MVQYESKTMHVVVNGKRNNGVSAKDIILAIVLEKLASPTRREATSSNTPGEAIRALSMDGRMTV